MSRRLDFADVKLRPEWSFGDLTFAETHRGTHAYHSYPMRFVPQFAEKLVRTYTDAGSVVCDPFMGSGTVLVESTTLGRHAVGVDANPLCQLITQAKASLIDPKQLSGELAKIGTALDRLSSFPVAEMRPEVTERLLYWHPKNTYEDLSRILSVVRAVPDEQIRTMFVCGFSQILKQCSYWWSGSTRAIRSDKRSRVPQEPGIALAKQLNLMASRNLTRWDTSSQDQPAWIQAEVGDARRLPFQDSSVDAVVTSPPYVTSYDYAELHQLSLLWLGYATSYQHLRGDLIGSQYGIAQPEDPASLLSKSQTAYDVVTALSNATRHRYLVRAVVTYFNDMWDALREILRVTRSGGNVVIVIGNTRLRGVAVKNAESLAEMMLRQGLRPVEIFRRAIPVKSIPQTRSPIDGRFSSSIGRSPYSEEYVLVFSKP